MRILVVLFAALFVAGCTGGDDDDDGSSPDSSPVESEDPIQPEDSTQPDALDPAQALPTSDDIAAHVDQLALEIGERPAGSEQEQETADYLQQQLESFGYDVEQQEFEISSAVNDLSTVEAEGQLYTAYAAQGSGTGEVEAALVYAEFGNAEQFPRETAGAIAVVQRGDIPFSQKVSNAQDAGARAIVIYNNEPGFTSVTLGAERADIPVVVVNGLDGGALKDAAEAGESGIVVATVRETNESQNVVARGGNGPCRIVVGGHYDSVTAVQGALDNASGTAAILEVAQSLAARDQTDGVCIVGFGSEEIGLLGSAHFVSELDADGRQALIAMFNLDAVGYGDELELVGSRALADQVLQVAEAQGMEVTRGELPPGASSDHASFLAEDLPAVAIFTVETGPIHTPQDTVELVNEDVITRAVLLTVSAIEVLNETT